MDDYVISHIRTFVPILVGIVVAWLTSKNITLDPKTVDGAIAFLTGTSALAYYALVRFLEQNISPRFGWLLGFAKKPGYNVILSEVVSGK